MFNTLQVTTNPLCKGINPDQVSCYRKLIQVCKIEGTGMSLMLQHCVLYTHAKD